MGINEVRHALAWCIGINYALLLTWVGTFFYAHDGLYRLHTRWFKLSPEAFDVLNYAGIAVYKIGIILFNLVPWLALYISF